MARVIQEYYVKGIDNNVIIDKEEEILLADADVDPFFRDLERKLRKAIRNRKKELRDKECVNKHKSSFEIYYHKIICREWVYFNNGKRLFIYKKYRRVED